MSWYTTIYPEGEFDPSKNEEKLQEEINEDKHILDYLWERITGICISNPSLYKASDPLQHVMNLAKQHFDKYVEISNKQNNACFNLEYVESKKWNAKYSSEDEDGKPLRPYIAYNHYQYEHDPEDGIKDCEESINKIRKMIIAYACASPKDIFIKDKEEEYGDSIQYITNKLDEYKEWLDEELYNLEFSRLCVKYWDTHEVG